MTSRSRPQATQAQTTFDRKTARTIAAVAPLVAARTAQTPGTHAKLTGKRSPLEGRAAKAALEIETDAAA